MFRIFDNLFKKNRTDVNIGYKPAKSDKELMEAARDRLQLIGYAVPKGKVIKSIPGVFVLEYGLGPMVFEANSRRAIGTILPNGMFNYLETRAGTELRLLESGRVKLFRETDS